MKTNFMTNKTSCFHFVIIVILLLSLTNLEQTAALQTPKPFFPKHNNNKHVNINLQQPSLFQVFGIYGLAPVIPSIVLPTLTQHFRSTQNPNDLLSILIMKRVFIYLIATLATSYAGWRASSSSTTATSPGESLDALNREILKGEIPLQRQEQGLQVETKVENDDNDDGLFATLLDENENVGKNVALVLPFFLTLALILSYLFLKGGPTSSPNLSEELDVKGIINSCLLISNFVICLLFSAAEYRSFVTPESDSKPESKDRLDTTSTSTQEQNSNRNDAALPNDKWFLTIPNAISLCSVLAAFLLPTAKAWPFQNSINISIAVSVTRALAPFFIKTNNGKSIKNIALALIGLSVYDVFSVFGTNLLTIQAASAAGVVFDTVDDTSFNLIPTEIGIETSTTILSSSSSSSSSLLLSGESSSVMETVARSKLQGPWRPGLLEMVLVGRVSDAIGLGDVVFPACLVAWGFSRHREDDNKLYAYSAICGYVLGSILTEVASIFGPERIIGLGGLPALLFITPAMLGCISLVAYQRGEVDAIWSDDREAEKDKL